MLRRRKLLGLKRFLSPLPRSAFREYFFIWSRNPINAGEKVAVVTYLMEGEVGETSLPLFIIGH